MPDEIVIENLRKKYQDQIILDDISFSVCRNSITVILGPNGCGKSTLLGILAGLTSHDGGAYYIKKFNPYSFSYIFQNYRESLLPWRTNLDNIILPLELQKKHPLYMAQKINILHQSIKDEFNLNGYPHQSSGGQQQMVAFWRALITEPKLLFIDESFSALDFENSLRFRKMLLSYHAEHKPTVLMISHDIEEAVLMADRVVILSAKPTKVVDVIDNPHESKDFSYGSSEAFRVAKEKVLNILSKVFDLK